MLHVILSSREGADHLRQFRIVSVQNCHRHDEEPLGLCQLIFDHLCFHSLGLILLF